MVTASFPKPSSAPPPRHRADDAAPLLTKTTPNPTPTPKSIGGPLVVDVPEPSIGELVHDASAHLSTLVHSEIELAKSEVTVSLKKGIRGAGFFGAAGVVLVFSLVFLLIAFAEGLVQLGLYRWLSYLIVWLVLVLIAAVAALLGIRSVKRIRKPERTIETLKDSKQLLQRGHSDSHSDSSS